MLNYETILSSYDDKLTLLEWLKKVEEALNGASATTFKVNKKGNATISFSIVFEDGSELESGDIVLEQGESVASAAIVNGHLELTLTNGDVLDAGSVGAVSSFSIDGSQHLIVTYQDGTTQDLGSIFVGNVNVAGNFTADSIIENMTGYSFLLRLNEITWTPIYVGVCKNGNKITFVAFGKFTYDNTTPESNPVFATFYIPTAVGSKLYPYAGVVLDTKKIDLIKNINVIDDEITTSMQKVSNGQVNVFFRSIHSAGLTNGTEYLFRYEVTFLLSDNLAA